MLINQQSIATVTQGFRGVFNDALMGAVPNDVGIKLAMVVPSSNATETWGWLEDVSGMKELIGEAKVEDLAADSYTIANKEWEKTVGVPRAAIERDSYGMYKMAIANMATGSKSHDSKMIGRLLTKGFTEKGYDGVTFFNVKHIYKTNKKVEYSNRLAKKLSSESFETARKMIRIIPNAAGEAMELGADLQLVVSAKNESVAKKILEAEKNEGGGDNVNKGTAKVIVWSYLDTAGMEDAWFLVDFGQNISPFIIQEEVKTQLLSADSLSDAEIIKTHKFIYQAYKRAGYGYGFPQLIVGSDGTVA